MHNSAVTGNTQCPRHEGPPTFFETCHCILPDDGRLVLQTIMGHPLKRWPEMGIPIVMRDLKFMRFIAKEVFPGGSIPCDEDIVEYSGRAGFSVQHAETLNAHYVRTLEIWAKNLEAARDAASRQRPSTSTTATCAT